MDDGWESRRKRTGGHDWCVIRLGAAACRRLRDRHSHFTGNYPPGAEIEVCAATRRFQTMRRAGRSHRAPGTEGDERVYVPRRTGEPVIPCAPAHLSRRRVAPPRAGAGSPRTGRTGRRGHAHRPHGNGNGGRGIVANDEPLWLHREPHRTGTRANNWRRMGDAARGASRHDWAVLELGASDGSRRSVIDTAHFKGNYRTAASSTPSSATDRPEDVAAQWRLGRCCCPKRSSRRTRSTSFATLADLGAIRFVRLNIIPMAESAGCG